MKLRPFDSHRPSAATLPNPMLFWTALRLVTPDRNVWSRRNFHHTPYGRRAVCAENLVYGTSPLPGFRGARPKEKNAEMDVARRIVGASSRGSPGFLAMVAGSHLWNIRAARFACPHFLPGGKTGLLGGFRPRHSPPRTDFPGSPADATSPRSSVSS